MIRHLRVLAVVGALALSAGPAGATGTQTASVSITASITQTCTALTPVSGTMTFPGYDPFTNKTAADDDSTPVTFTTNCTKGSTGVYYTVSGGNNCANSPVNGTRALKSGSNYVAYQLYQDSAYTAPWAINAGCTGTTQLSAGTITSSSQNLTFSLYGQIPAGQDPVAASNYSDTVTVAVNF